MGACDTAKQRIEPKGHPSDTLLDYNSWAPKAWIGQKWTPESLQGFAAPWLLYDGQGFCRRNYEEWPASGVGQFVTVLGGKCVICAWDTCATIAKGATTARSWDFLFESVNYATFKEWASRHLIYAAPTLGSTIWIPYGW